MFGKYQCCALMCIVLCAVVIQAVPSQGVVSVIKIDNPFQDNLVVSEVVNRLDDVNAESVGFSITSKELLAQMTVAYTIHRNGGDVKTAKEQLDYFSSKGIPIALLAPEKCNEAVQQWTYHGSGNPANRVPRVVAIVAQRLWGIDNPAAARDVSPAEKLLQAQRTVLLVVTNSSRPDQVKKSMIEGFVREGLPREAFDDVKLRHDVLAGISQEYQKAESPEIRSLLLRRARSLYNCTDQELAQINGKRPSPIENSIDEYLAEKDSSLRDSKLSELSKWPLTGDEAKIVMGRIMSSKSETDTELLVRILAFANDKNSDQFLWDRLSEDSHSKKMANAITSVLFRRQSINPGGARKVLMKEPELSVARDCADMLVGWAREKNVAAEQVLKEVVESAAIGIRTTVLEVASHRPCASLRNVLWERYPLEKDVSLRVAMAVNLVSLGDGVAVISTMTKADQEVAKKLVVQITLVHSLDSNRAAETDQLITAMRQLAEKMKDDSLRNAVEEKITKYKNEEQSIIAFREDTPATSLTRTLQKELELNSKGALTVGEKARLQSLIARGEETIKNQGNSSKEDVAGLREQVENAKRRLLQETSPAKGTRSPTSRPL